MFFAGECENDSECRSDQACFNFSCKDSCQDACGVNAQCKALNHGEFLLITNDVFVDLILLIANHILYPIE